MTNNDAAASITAEELATAVAERQFSLRYQPKLDCEILALKGFEALVRWEHPTKGQIMPGQFIPLAEECDLIGQITEQVISQAFFWYSGTSGVPGLSLSINMSAKRLGDKDFAEWLHAMCRRAGIRTDSVILEISEGAAMGERLLALDMFTRLKEKGFRVAIDDFGTGPSSLQLLVRLPFAEVKIDKSYGMTAMSSPTSKEFIRKTVELAHNNDLKVVCEGIEDRATLDYVRSLRCDFVLGYLISPPMDEVEAHDWLLNRRKMTRHLLV